MKTLNFKTATPYTLYCIAKAALIRNYAEGVTDHICARLLWDLERGTLIGVVKRVVME